MKKYFLLLSLILVLPISSFAASIKSLNPDFQAGEDVSFYIERSAVDPLISSVVWVYDGEIISDQKEITIPNIDYGEHKLKAIVKFVNNKTQTLSLNFSVSKVQILWEAKTFTPFFYKAAKLPSIGSEFKAYALADFKNKDELIYIWKKNGKILNVSGKGAYAIEFSTDYFTDSFLLSVDVLDKSGNTLGSAQAFINIVEPKIMLYYKDELLSWMFNKPIQNSLYLAYPKEVLAMPFYMSAKDLFDDNIEWSWLINDIPVLKDGNSSPYVELSFKDKVGSAILNIKAQYKKHILQKAQKIITLINSQKSTAKTKTNTSEPNPFGI